MVQFNETISNSYYILNEGNNSLKAILMDKLFKFRLQNIQLENPDNYNFIRSILFSPLLIFLEKLEHADKMALLSDGKRQQNTRTSIIFQAYKC